jgi:hypothetical protein
MVGQEWPNLTILRRLGMAGTPKNKVEFDDDGSRERGLAKVGKARYLIDFTSGQIDPRLDGECLHDTIQGLITIDPTLRGKDCFDTVVHEILHGYLDHTGLLTKVAWKRREEIITELANQISDVIFTPECMRRCGF